MGVPGVFQCDAAHRIYCFPPVRSSQQGQGLRDLSPLQPSNGHGGSTAGQQGVRDTRSNATRQQGTATCVSSSCHFMIMRPSLVTKPAVLTSAARGKHTCTATPNDASSSPEAFFQPPSGDLDHQSLRAASQQVGDAAQHHREPSSPSRIPGSKPEQTCSSSTAAAQPDRAHFKPGEVLKQSTKRSVRRRNAKEVVIDVAGEAVPDDSSRQDNAASPVLRSDISPGDPMEEGWVADTRNDVRAQHWMSENSTYTPVAWSGPVFLGGSAGGLSSAGRVDEDDRSGWGGRPGHTSDGGGGGGGSRSGRSTAEGDNQGDAAANATVIVYTFLVAVLVFFWTNIYIVVSKPEKIGTIGRRVAKFMSSAHWRVKQLQRQKSVACAAPLKTRYRTLTVYKSGYSRLARRLISPAPAVDVETAEGSHIDRDSAYTSMFLEVPRPPVFAHPVSLRRKSAARHSADLSSSQRLPALDSSPSLPSMSSALFSPAMLGIVKGHTPFNDDESSGVLIPLPSLRRASGALPGTVFFYDSGVLADDEGRLGTPSPEVPANMEMGFNSLTFDTPSPWPQPSPSRPFQRHATWTGRLDTQETDEGLTNTDEYRDLQRHFVSNLLPGSLARVSLQRHSASASARPDISPYTPPPPAFQRTTSQPIIESEALKVQQKVKKQGGVRRSASLHSLRDVLGPAGSLSNTGSVLDAHRLTGDLAE